MLHDAQSEPGAARFARAGFVDPVEPFEDAGLLLTGDAQSVVAHDQDGRAALMPHPDPHVAAGAVVAQGVLHQVADESGQLHAVTVHPHRR